MLFKILLIGLVNGLFICGNMTGVYAQPLKIFVSIPPQIEMVEAIGKDRVLCESLLPAGSSPEFSDLQPIHLIKLNHADLYFPIGTLPFERSTIKRLNGLYPDLKIGKTPFSLIGQDHHVWMSLIWTKKHVDMITAHLIELDRGSQSFYEANRNAYVENLDKTMDQYRLLFREADKKAFVINHSALTYYARDFGLIQLSIEKDGKDPTIRDLKNLINIAKKNQVNLVLVQSQEDTKLSKQVAKQLSATLDFFDPLNKNYYEQFNLLSEKILKYLDQQTQLEKN